MLLNAFECIDHSFELVMINTRLSAIAEHILQCQQRTNVQGLRGSAAVEMKLKNKKHP